MAHCIVTGLEFASRREMEQAYGLDSVEQMHAECAELYAEEDAVLTAAFGPLVCRVTHTDDIPF